MRTTNGDPTRNGPAAAGEPIRKQEQSSGGSDIQADASLPPSLPPPVLSWAWFCGALVAAHADSEGCVL